ncbi:hypothetical protein AB0F81_48725 [Actinoplanes sp. NPDC024001]|uniref:hypothetical protein n=1 Tax=Actinoplanes sp. NPDC024001 TaxID=3154598 RepID=UPI0033C89AA6
MTKSLTATRGLLVAAAIPVLLLGACARPGTAAETSAGDGAAGGPALESASVPAGDPDRVALRVDYRGGFVPPDYLVGRLPMVTVYADGRVITDGPVPLIAPGPALPNLQVQRIEPGTVRKLAAEAVAAGVKDGADFGSPGVADVPSTRVTVDTGYGTETVEAIALREAQPDDPALTAEQKAARKKLAAFVDKLTGLSTATKPYEPDEVAAIASPYVKSDDGLGGAPVPWPGPALPGEALNPALDVHCLSVTGAQKDAVWAAAQKANQQTPWESGGKQWRVMFRPLLPDESGCAALQGSGQRSAG